MNNAPAASIARHFGIEITDPRVERILGEYLDEASYDPPREWTEADVIQYREILRTSTERNNRIALGQWLIGRTLI